MIMQSSVKNTNFIINIEALGSFPYERETRADPHIDIKTREFGLILIGSLLSDLHTLF